MTLLITVSIYFALGYTMYLIVLASQARFFKKVLKAHPEGDEESLENKEQLRIVLNFLHEEAKDSWFFIMLTWPMYVYNLIKISIFTPKDMMIKNAIEEVNEMIDEKKNK